MTKFYLSLSRYLTVLLFLVTTVAWSQSRTVTGKVTSADDGSGLPGVNVVEKGTNNGTVTDVNGSYSVNVGDNATLVFSFVGYASQEVVVGSQSTINITLASDVTALSEVVVVGYGTQEKKEITSAVTSVKSEDFNRGTVNDPAQLLQGKVAGLNITRPGGDPNGGFNIRLRGISTFGANQEPLIVIDGVIGGSFSTVDPNDIAAIDVLKDGSAAAIYGTRGSSGVILITTKSGKAGKPTVDYNGSYAIETINNSIDVMSGEEYRQVAGAQILSSQNTDWLDAVTQNGNAMVHNISVGGGSGGTNYRASVNLRDANGIALNSGFTQLNGRLNLTQRALNDRATFNVNLSSTTKNAEYGFKESFRYAIISNPTMPIYDENTTGPTAGAAYGGYAERAIFDYFNPLSIAEQNINDGKDTRLLASIRGEYDFGDVVDGLRVALFYSQQRESDMRGEYYSKTAKFRGSGRNGLARKYTDQRFNHLFETTVNYNKNFGNVEAALLGGYSYQYFVNEGFGLEGGNFLTDAFGYNNMSQAADFANGLGSIWSYQNDNTLVAFFGRANINWQNNFYLSASARYEGSSRFGVNQKFGLFPAVSAGATLSNLFDIPAVNSLKLRASWGVTGAQPSDSYISIIKIQGGGNFYYNGAYRQAFGPTTNPNPDLKWETKDEFDVGLDFALLDSKLTGTMDYYVRTTSDLILSVPVPQPPAVAGQSVINIGEHQSSGFELALNYQAVRGGDFTWTPGVNFSTFKIKVTSLTSGDLAFGEGGVFYTAGMGAPGQNAFELVRVKEGEELGQLWGPIETGLDANGVPQYEDLDGDGTFCDCDADKAVIGNGLPDFTLNINNSFTYKNFDLNFLFRGAFGHDLINSYRGFYENRESTTVGNYNIVKTKYYDDAVTKAAVSNVHVEKASFMRLDNMQLGYNVRLKPGVAVNRLRFSVSGQNLLTFTDYTGVDPEVRYVDKFDSDNGGREDQNSNPFAPGIERRSTYFTTRTITFGVALGF